MPTQLQYPASLDEAAARATAEASRRWQRLVSMPGGGRRIVTAAIIAWDAAYPIAYAHGYTTLAARAVAAFEDLHQHPGSAEGAHRTAVRRLVETVQTAQPRFTGAPPLRRRVLQLAAVAALNRLDGRTAPQAINQAVHREAVIEGGTHGALTAARDINTGWRTRTNAALLIVRSDSL